MKLTNDNARTNRARMIRDARNSASLVFEMSTHPHADLERKQWVNIFATTGVERDYRNTYRPINN